MYSCTRKSAQGLAQSLDCSFTTNLKKIDEESDIIIIAVKDDVIPAVVDQLSYLENGKRLFLHTSGSTSLSTLTKTFSKCGIFWPPQSIKKGSKIDMRQTPFMVVAEGNSIKGVSTFAKRISKKVNVVTEEQKSNLHLAAVFANNFTNHFFGIAHDICKKQELDFDLLLPIIKETAAKITSGNPRSLQTGPAIRGDEDTIKNHKRLLKSNPHLKKIYTLLTESIQANLK